MKKLLVVLLALAMVFGFAAFASAADTEIPDYTDKAASDEGSVATYRLTSIGILEGDGWGKAYRWSDSMTRSELAKIACYMFIDGTAKEDSAVAASLGTIFYKDVPSDWWALGYINLATQLGLMKGVGSGNFNPNGTVSMQEAVTVVLRALGYDDNLPGVWPADYISKALKIELTKYTDFFGAKAINREELAILINNALDLYVVQYVGNEVAAGLGYLAHIVDLDGYSYCQWATNEEEYLAKIYGDLGMDFDRDGARHGHAYVTLGYYVFDILGFYDYFSFGDEEFSSNLIDHEETGLDYLEASGWGYANFKDGDLFFSVIGADGVGKVDKGDVADNYYIWGGDLVDLGARAANFTWKVEDEEIIFVELVGKTSYDSEIKKDEYKASAYADDAVPGSVIADVQAGGLFGEFVYDEDGDIIFFDNYKEKLDDRFMIVDTVKNGKITDAKSGETLQFEKYKSTKADLNGANFVFYNMTASKWIAGSDLQFGDVLYGAGLVGNDTFLVLVIEPAKGTLSKVDGDYAYIDGNKTKVQFYNEIFNSYCSTDSGKSFRPFDYDFYPEILSKDIVWASSYVPGYFGYISDDVVEYEFGVVLGFETELRVRRADGFHTFDYASMEVLSENGEKRTIEFDEDAVDPGNNIGNYGVDLDDVMEGSLVCLYIENGKIVDMAEAVAWNNEDLTDFADYDGSNINWFDFEAPAFRIAIEDAEEGIITVDGYKAANGVNNLYDAYISLDDDVVIFRATSDKWGELKEVSIMSREDFLASKNDYIAWFFYADDTSAEYLYVIDDEQYDYGEFWTIIDGKETYYNLDSANYELTIGEITYTLTREQYVELKDVLKNKEYGLMIYSQFHELTDWLFVIGSQYDAALVDYFQGGDYSENNSFKLDGTSYKIYYNNDYAFNGSLLSVDGAPNGSVILKASTIYFDCQKNELVDTDTTNLPKNDEDTGIVVITDKNNKALYVLFVDDEAE